MTDDDYALCEHTAWVDHEIKEIGRQILLIPALHPLNTAEEKAKFLRRQALSPPTFVYRKLSYDPAELRARLKKVSSRAGRIRSRWLRSIFRAKIRELNLKLGLVAQRGTAHFLPLSMRLFPRPTLGMLSDARVLARLPPSSHERRLSAEQVARSLRATIRCYQKQHRSFRCNLKWVDSSLAEASVSDSQLNIRKESGYSDRFLLLLQHHEIGVHLVTAQNGDHQKLNLLRGGLAGYDQTQEGLALFAEFRAGAITTNRLRVLGARVAAVDLLCRGASFVEIYAALTAACSFTEDEAFSICLRCFRGGGYTKDAIYQPGFLAVFNYWLQGGDLPTLFVGKFPLSQVQYVKEAMRHGLVKAPLFGPPLIADEGRLHAERAVLSLLRARRGNLVSVNQLAMEKPGEEAIEETSAIPALGASQE